MSELAKSVTFGPNSLSAQWCSITIKVGSKFFFKSLLGGFKAATPRGESF